MAFTFFFRDSSVIEAAVKELAPLVMGRSFIRIWDAGCAMGPELYTLAMILAEKMGKYSFRNVRITATDYDTTFEETVKNAVYDYEFLKRIPPEYFNKYFEKTDKETEFKLVEDIRNKIEFRVHDLLKLEPAGSNFSFILCKNVLLHFPYPERVKVITMFHGALAADGLFVTEHTQEMPKECEHLFKQVVSNARIYKKI